MTKLRLLQINNVELEGNLKLLPSELKWIQWKGCPLENLPPDFLARQLSVLDLSESGIRQVQTLRNKMVSFLLSCSMGKHIVLSQILTVKTFLCFFQVDENLKVVILRGCHSLEAIPDLSNHEALEKLVFQQSTLKVKVPKTLGKLRK